MSTGLPITFTEQFSYEEALQRIVTDGGPVFVLSDFHLGSGLNKCNNYIGTENFVADQSFRRLIDFLLDQKSDKSRLLIINGDLIDFLRVTLIPGSEEDIENWQTYLAAIGIVKSKETLKNSISKRERQFGLETNDYKSVWKLMIASKGHQVVIDSLAAWLVKGNQLVMLKGNHDLELFWKLVRDAFRMELCKSIQRTSTKELQAIANEIVSPQVIFADQAIIVDDRMYFEHGHRFERFTTVDGPPVLKNKIELNLPFGSFFNRYLINRIELAYPYVDNIRPRQNILSILIRERFPLAIKLLFFYLPLTIRVIPKKQYRYAFYFLFQFLAIIILPVLVTGFAIYKTIHISDTKTTGIWGLVLPVLKDFVFMSLSYFIGRIISALELSSPSSFFPFTKDILLAHPEIEIISFGHTHNPEKLVTENNVNYYNTGTWIPVFEASAADLRLDKTYTVLCITRETGDRQCKGDLVRWNDDANRLDTLPLMQRS